ncbi:TPA: GFA family protein [Salmonella enterica subsp. enterica serovar Casablanca]|nr:GFA family protein [Salmonella enterica subsp. enterica serovar Casablanca]
MTSEKLSAACHCGSVVFTVQLSDGFYTARRCNCSFCRMRGAMAVSAPLSGIKVLKGQDKLTEYRFNTGKAVHFFYFACVEVNDGVTHPSDGGSSGVVGYLRYEPKTSPPVETGGKNI